MSKILLLEDENALNEMIVEYLGDLGYEVVGVKSYEEAESLAYEKSFDVWIFDVKVVGGDGFSLLKSLRQSGKLTPCIFTTSLNSIDDLDLGFESGCDDYLKKPFELAELKLRVGNLLKRNFAHQFSKKESLGGGLEFDLKDKILYKNSQILPLSAKESRLLTLFLQNRDKVVTKEQIFSEVWDYDELPSGLSLRVYIRNLRKIFGDRIVSKPKIGYIFKS